MTTTHAPGRFCWIDLATTDIQAAERFYGALFGWTTVDMSGPGQPYHMIRLGGHDIGGIHLLPESQRAAGVPPHWLPYIAVADAEATLALVREHGGGTVVEPRRIGEAGVTAVARDPQGAQVALWQAAAHRGAGVLDEPGAMTWNELGTSDVAAAAAFYGAVFGWQLRAEPNSPVEYHTFVAGDEMRAGCYPLAGPMAGIPPHWMTYWATRDTDATAERAKSLGGQVHVPPSDIPGVGRFAMLRDPQGAYSCVIALQAPG